MTADEILKALEESEGFYLEVNGWVIARAAEEFVEGWEAAHYTGHSKIDRAEWRETLPEAIKFALKDGKP